MKAAQSEAKQRPWVKLLWAGLVLQSMTYCSGSTDRGGGGGGGSGGFSYAGHTAGCAKNCSLGGCLGSPGCPLPGGGNSGSGGTPSSGSGGMLGGIGGTPPGGIGGFGFSGHTADCLNNCHQGCSQQCGGTSSGGTPAAGASGLGGALDGLGGAAEGGQATGGEPAAMRRSPGSESGACYALTGYEADPCLPADDALLQWLNSPNLGCPLTVVSGPTLMNVPSGRACCYSVGCAQPTE